MKNFEKEGEWYAEAISPFEKRGIKGSLPPPVILQDPSVTWWAIATCLAATRSSKLRVGRPDLGGHVIEWSAELFRTSRERIASLSDDVMVLPAHYANVWEIGPEGVGFASLGELRRGLPELQIEDAEQRSDRW